MTGIGVILGTAAYMAPEQARGKAVDKRADIWAFGVVVFELLTGRRLFPGSEASDTLAFVLTKEPDWTLAQLVARAYATLHDYKNETAAWQIVTRANPNVATYFENLALSAWAAKQNELGDLASAKALSLTPKAQQAQMKQTLQQLKSQAGSLSASTPSGG